VTKSPKVGPLVIYIFHLSDCVDTESIDLSYVFLAKIEIS
jgi:hypothetical protein